jgi:hypothetical protein
MPWPWKHPAKGEYPVLDINRESAPIIVERNSKHARHGGKLAVPFRVAVFKDVGIADRISMEWIEAGTGVRLQGVFRWIEIDRAEA